MAQETQCALWQFRFGRRDSEYSLDDIKAWCRAWGKHWVFQKERGDGGLIHFQGMISLVKKRRKVELLPLFERTEPNIVPEFFTPTCGASIRGGTDEFYAQKTDTRIEGPWTDRDRVLFIPYHLQGIMLRPWQQYIADSAKPEFRNHRVIDLIFDPVGNRGKSIVCDFIRIHHGGIEMPAMNDGQRLCESLCDILYSQDNHDPKIVLFDMPRAMSKSALHGLYSAIEQIKRGFVADTRNHYKQWEYHPPRVWIFTNTIPDMAMLSADRWNLWTIGDDLHLHRQTLAGLISMTTPKIGDV